MNHGNRGFTLLEVLIAMAIVGLGLSAVFVQMNQMAGSALYLQQRTFGTWVALDLITEIRLADEFPEVKEYEKEIETLGQEWAYTVNVSETELPDFRRIDVTVYPADNPDNILATVSGFTGRRGERLAPPVLPGQDAAVEEGNFR